MGSFPTGVTVVTVASHDGGMHGVTVNSFSSVSLDPLLVLVCLHETSRAVGQIERGGAFGVSVLSAGQQDISRWFANGHRPAGPAMFDGVPVELGAAGCPLLAGAAASFECRRRHSYRAGDHLIMLGGGGGAPPRAGATGLPRRNIQGVGARVRSWPRYCTPLPPAPGRTWSSTAPTCGLTGHEGAQRRQGWLSSSRVVRLRCALLAGQNPASPPRITRV